jgi:hypothetical protein
MSLGVGLGASGTVLVVAEVPSLSRLNRLDAGTDFVTIKPVVGHNSSMRFFLIGGGPSNRQICDSERHSYFHSVICAACELQRTAQLVSPSSTRHLTLRFLQKSPVENARLPTRSCSEQTDKV